MPEINFSYYVARDRNRKIWVFDTKPTWNETAGEWHQARGVKFEEMKSLQSYKEQFKIVKCGECVRIQLVKFETLLFNEILKGEDCLPERPK